MGLGMRDFKINRRKLLAASTALAILANAPAYAWLHPGAATGVPSGWQRLGIGDGGFVTGGWVSPSGLSTGAVCRTDVAGAYVYDSPNAIWNQVCNNESLGNITVSPTAGGCIEIAAASDLSRLCMMYGDPAVGLGAYAIWISTDKGQSWTKTVTFTANSHAWTPDGFDIPNGGQQRLAGQKIVFDPGNPLVIYVGIPYDCTLTGAWAGQTASVMRSVDGGATWASVSGLPLAYGPPGYAGMVVDTSSATTTLSGQTVYSRLVFGCNQNGVYESNDGGSTWTKASADATPSTILSITTTQADDIIVVQVYNLGWGAVTGITDTGDLTWTRRDFGINGPSLSSSETLEVWWAHAPTAATYTITVAYSDGAIAGINGPTAATCTAAQISTSGTVTTLFAPLASTTGAFAVGQILTSGPSQSGLHIVSQTDSEHWVLQAATNNFTGTPRTVTAAAQISRQVVAFAVNGANLTTPFQGTAVNQFFQQNGRGTLTTTGTALVFSCAHSNSVGNDTGYTLLNSSTTYQFWSQIASAPQAAGGYAVPTTGAVSGTPAYITDAIYQATGKTIAIDGSAVYGSSAPATGLQPVDIQTAQIDAAGTYWCTSGPQPVVTGGIWRYVKGSATWDRMDGNNDPLAAPGGKNYIAFGTPGPNSYGNCTCVDPRSGHLGQVSFSGPWGNYRGYQTTNGSGTASLVNWTGGTGGTTHVTITSSIGWLATTTTGSGPVGMGDMHIDPITGDYIQFGGAGVLQYSTLQLNGTSVGVNISEGIEETLVPTILTPPGAPYPLVGLEDEILVQCVPGGYPQNVLIGGDSDGWSLDYAADNPGYVCAYVTGISTQQASSWSYNFGNSGSWTPFNTSAIPSHSALNGNIACASVGSDGLIPTNATACLCLIPQWQNSSNVYYSLNNGGSWATSTFVGLTLPKVFCASYNTMSHLLVSDKPGGGTPNGIYYLFVPDTGLFKSTDYGANFSRVNTLTFGGANTAYGFNLQSVEGRTGHLFLSGASYTLTPFNFYYSTNGGTTLTAVPGVDSCFGYALGKAKAGNGYAVSVIVYGIISSISASPAMYIGDCNGSDPSAGFTWTNVGTLLPTNTIIPRAAAAYNLTTPTSSKNSGIVGMWGDLNLYGRIFIPGAQNGVIMRQP